MTDKELESLLKEAVEHLNRKESISIQIDGPTWSVRIVNKVKKMIRDAKETSPAE